MTVIKYGHTDCSNCDQTMKVWLYDDIDVIREGQFVQVDNGLCFDISGHYNGFVDDVDLAFGSAVYAVCHDCALAVWRALGGITKRHLGSSHMPADYVDGDPSCCEYAFKMTEENGVHVYWAGDRDGGWTRVEE